MANKKAVVVGARGTTGRNVVQALEAVAPEILVLDNLEQGEPL